MAEGEKTEKRTLYCPKCHTRYATSAEECVTCKRALVGEQPQDDPLFKPKIDLPFVVLAVLFMWFYSGLPGEAQSFGMIFLLVGAAALVAFRLIHYAEWLGRR